jgi:3-oxoadipate enol-lactonase
MAASKIATNGTNLNYRVDGPGDAPWLTFSNSLATTLSLWDTQVAELAKSFRVLRYDTRGHGGSDSPEGPYSLAMLRDDVLGLLDALGIEKFHFFGISLGGMTALELALAAPERIGRIAVCDSRADAPPAFAKSFDERVAIVREKGMDAIVEQTLVRWFSAGFHAQEPPELAKVGGMIGSTSLGGYIGCVRALQTLDLLPRLGGVTAPTLFVSGADDVATPPDSMRAMHEAVAGSQFVLIDPAGHLSNIENPGDFMAAVGPFLLAA